MNHELFKMSFLCFLLLIGLAIPITSEDLPYNPHGGGIVYGQILGYNYLGFLMPVVWADVAAWQNGELINQVSSMSNGYFDMILPVGEYTLTVEEPGFEQYSREIFVSSGSGTAHNVVLERSGEPIHKPEEPPEPALYTVQIFVTGIPSYLKTQLSVDGVVKSEMSNEDTLDLQFEVGSSHTIVVEKQLESEEERYLVDEPSIVVSAALIHEFEYKGEYLLIFIIEPEDLSLPSVPQEGWYPSGTTISTPTVPSIIEDPSGVRFLFEKWTLNGEELTSDSIEFTMDKPVVLKIVYSKEYNIEVSSIYGAPKGSGWYEDGSTATISVEPSIGILPRQVFAGWSGDYAGKEATSTITVDKPMHIIAVWTTDYTLLVIIIVSIVVVLTAATVAILIKYQKRG